MTDIALTQINVVATDLAATTAFSRLLGVDAPAPTGDWPAGSGAQHVDIRSEGGPAVAADLDGVHVGLMGSRDRTRFYEPTC